VNKDLFEQRLGETLRQAESTPPEGAWEFIQSRIQSPYTPPFSFPTWAVVAVSAVLLGAMTMSDMSTEQESDSERIAVNVVSDSDVLKVEETKGAVVEAEVVSVAKAESENISAKRMASEPIGAVEITASTKSESSEIEVLESEPNKTSVMAGAESQKSSASQLPVQVQANSLWTEELTEISDRETKTEVEEPVNSSESFEPQLSIEGVKTCYTPCELQLSAKGNASEYAWDAATFGFFQGKSLNLTIEEPRSLTVYAIAKYADGSEKTIPQTIEVKKGSSLDAPNSFTPNGDGINDNYFVIGNGIVSFTMTIINSKGKVVFKTNDINEAWNFSGSNLELENEVYTAIIRATGIDGKVHAENQRLTILP